MHPARRHLGIRPGRTSAGVREPSQYDDLDAFRAEQALLQRLAAESILPVLELDMSDGDVEGACDAIADWMTGRGGLWPRGETPAEGPPSPR